MFKKKTQRIVAILVCVSFGGLLLPVFGDDARNTAVQARVEPGTALGVTASKALNVNLVSARDPNFALLATRDATGDTYDAAGLLQDAGSAYYVDDLPDSHTFGTGEESAGANLISGVDTRIVGTDFGPGLPGTSFLQVNYFTADGSDIVPTGAVSPDQLIYQDWRLDVGTVAAGTDKINWTSSTGFTVVDTGFCLAIDGSIAGCFDLLVDDSDACGLSGVGVVGLGGADIAGYGVDEMIMYWEIQEHIPGDLDVDGDVDLADYAIFQSQFDGPS